MLITIELDEGKESLHHNKTKITITQEEFERIITANLITSTDINARYEEFKFQTEENHFVRYSKDQIIFMLDQLDKYQCGYILFEENALKYITSEELLEHYDRFGSSLFPSFPATYNNEMIEMKIHPIQGLPRGNDGLCGITEKSHERIIPNFIIIAKNLFLVMDKMNVFFTARKKQ